MSQFTLYSAPGSSNADRIRFTLAEAGFSDFETVLINLRAGEHKSTAHLARHPWGKVPAVTFSDGLTLYESRPICKYLASKYNFPLIPPPSDLEDTALFDQAQSIESLYFQDAAGKISFEKFAKTMMGLPADEAIVGAAVKSLDTFFGVIDGILAHQEYMAGSKFTLVDIYYIPLMARLVELGYSDLFRIRDHLSGWWKRVASRPAIKQLLDADKAAMRLRKSS